MSARAEKVATRAAAERAARASVAMQVFEELSAAVLPATKRLIDIALHECEDEKLALAACQKIVAEWKDLARKPIDDTDMRSLANAMQNMVPDPDMMASIASDPEKAGEFLARLGRESTGNA